MAASAEVEPSPIALWTTPGTSDGRGIDWLGDSRWQIAGIVLVEALHFYPILLLNLQASLANIDPAMEQAAEPSPS